VRPGRPALVFLQNTTGYMAGSAAGRGGAIKHGAKMIQAVANARAPKFTVVLGGSFGLALARETEARAVRPNTFGVARF